MYIDSHCHLDLTEFDRDRGEVLLRAREQGLCGFVVPGVDPEQWFGAQALCQVHNDVFFAVGLHPWWAERALALFSDVYTWAESEQARVEMFADSDKCVAIGECGLDKNIELSLPQQIEILETHIAWSQAFHLPLILHCVKAHAELLAVLKRHPLNAGAVLHGFSGSELIAKEYWRIGVAIGVGGTISYERANKTRQAIAAMPLEALVLETDAPSMPLAGKQGERNSPEYVPLIAQALAELRRQSVDEIQTQLFNNTQRLFPKLVVPDSAQ